MKASNYIGCIILFFIILFTFFKFEGLSNPLAGTMNEIENNNFIDCIGIDYITSDKMWRVSVAFPSLKAKSDSNNQSGIQNDNELLIAEGKTVFEAHRKLHLLTTRKLLYNHTNWILIGETAAKASMLRSLEFELRDYERGWNTHVAIIKDITAEEFLSSIYKRDEHIEKLITGFREMSDNLSISDEITFVDLFNAFDKNESSYCIPYYILRNKNSKDEENDSGKNMMSGGLAIIIDHKLFNFLNREQSRGVNWVTGNIKSSSIVVKDTLNEDASLEVLKAHSDIKTSFIDGKPAVKIKIMVSGQINELMSEKAVVTNEYVDKLEKAMDENIKSEIESVLSFAKENKTDIFEIGDSFYHQHPIKWKAIESNWDSIFQSLDINLDVQSTIMRTGKFRESMISEGAK